ncbi:MAG: fatty-acid synthase [Burkholderiales bacterium]|nr:fatty-acid synthase [Anaerolineae bacterium]
MPAKDRYHDAVKRALVKSEWIISDEQVTFQVEDRIMWIDIEAVNVAAALVILIEVKELENVASSIEALANALGKFLLYRLALEEARADVPLFLAVSELSYQGILTERIGQLVIQRFNIPLIVFDPEREEFTRWIP